MSAELDRSQAERLRKQLINQQPHSKALLDRLVARMGEGKQGAFAQIRNGRCAACNLKVAAVRLQQAKLGEFVNCASCSRFLYIEADYRQ